MSLETALRKLRAAEEGVPRAQERAARIIAGARERVDQARAALAEEIRAADRAGMRQVDIVAATGYVSSRIPRVPKAPTTSPFRVSHMPPCSPFSGVPLPSLPVPLER